MATRPMTPDEQEMWAQFKREFLFKQMLGQLEFVQFMIRQHLEDLAIRNAAPEKKRSWWRR